LREHRDELDRRQALVVVVGFEASRRLRGYCRGLQLGTWPCLVDKSRTVYRLYGLGQLPWWRTFNLASLRGYWRFWRQGRRMPGLRADLYQAGGDFVIDPDGRLALVHPGRGPHDRPSVEQILAAFEPGGQP
jgi:hypothetical protein